MTRAKVFGCGVVVVMVLLRLLDLIWAPLPDGFYSAPLSMEARR